MKLIFLTYGSMHQRLSHLKLHETPYPHLRLVFLTLFWYCFTLLSHIQCEFRRVSCILQNDGELFLWMKRHFFDLRYFLVNFGRDLLNTLEWQQVFMKNSFSWIYGFFKRIKACIRLDFLCIYCKTNQQETHNKNFKLRNMVLCMIWKGKYDCCALTLHLTCVYGLYFK